MDRSYLESETREVAQGVLKEIRPIASRATIVGLEGDLGAGKTTLIKEIAQTLGLTETIISPTYVIMKFYELTNKDWDQLIHIDAYRIEDISELNPLGWSKIISTPKTLILIEWPEKIRSAIPEGVQYFKITHQDKDRYIKSI